MASQPTPQVLPRVDRHMCECRFQNNNQQPTTNNQQPTTKTKTKNNPKEKNTTTTTKTTTTATATAAATAAAAATTVSASVTFVLRCFSAETSCWRLFVVLTHREPRGGGSDDADSGYGTTERRNGPCRVQPPLSSKETDDGKDQERHGPDDSSLPTAASTQYFALDDDGDVLAAGS